MPRKPAEKLKRPDYKDSFLLARIVSREEWTAYPPSRTDPPLQHPIESLVFSGVNAVPEVDKNSEEKEKGKRKGKNAEKEINYAMVVKQIQTRDMSFYGMADIKSNFLIGQDGLVYEGRGWHVQSGRPNDYPGYEGKYLEITFIGDCNSDTARRATGHLLDVGKNYKYVASHIKILKPEQRTKEVRLEDEVIMKFELITRLEWEALPPRGDLEKIDHPVAYVSISYVTTSDKNIPPVEAVRHLQKRDMLKGMADIQSNFYIAADGMVFEGRGWLLQPGNKNERPGKEGKFIEFTYLGDFSREEMDHPAYISTGLLLELGVKDNYVHKTAVFLTQTDLLESSNPTDPNRRLF